MARLKLMGACAAAGLLLVAGCTDAPVATPGALVVDPYVDLPGGGARYAGDVTAGATEAVLPGTPTPQAFAAMAGAIVTFPADQVALTPEAQAIVARQAEWLSRHRDFRAVIEGHADEQGTREHNLALGARRAASVQQQLIARGIEPGRISTVSYGNERPLEACNDDACFERNRRAVTVVSPAGPGV